MGDKMLMILTYDFESSLPKNADFLSGVTLKNLDEFNKADEFDTFIRKHFASKQSKKNKKNKVEEMKEKTDETKEEKNDEIKEEKKDEMQTKEEKEKNDLDQIKMKEIQKADSLGDDETYSL